MYLVVFTNKDCKNSTAWFSNMDDARIWAAENERNAQGMMYICEEIEAIYVDNTTTR